LNPANVTNIFIDIFFSAWGLPLWMGIGAALGIFVGMWLTRPKKNQVCKLIPEDSRGYDLDIEEENANFVYCEGIETLPPQRFLKFRKSFTITQRRRLGKFLKINRLLAREGTAYAQRIESGEITNVSLSKVLIALWGPENYDTVRSKAPELIDLVEKGKVNVTIGLEEDPITPHNLKPMSEENIKTEEDKQAARVLWKGMKESLKESFIHNFAYIGSGIAMGILICILMGWVPIGTGAS